MIITNEDIKCIIDDAKLKAIIRNDKECTYHDIITSTVERFWKFDLVIENQRLKSELYFLKFDKYQLKGVIKKIQNTNQDFGFSEDELEDLQYLMEEEKDD